MRGRGRIAVIRAASGCLVRGGEMPRCCAASPEKGRSAGGRGGGVGFRHLFSDLKEDVPRFLEWGRGTIIINVHD